MRILTDMDVEIKGLFRRAHRFVADSRRIGELRWASGTRRGVFQTPEGVTYEIRRRGLWRITYALTQGEMELGTAQKRLLGRSAEIEYRNVPYFLAPSRSDRRVYALYNERDAVVLTIARSGLTSRRATIRMNLDADIALVVLAYCV